jgi:hypothetical protein
VFGSARRFFGLLSATCAGSALLAFAIPVSAQASLVSLNACDNSSLGQPFTSWADPNYYKLAPGADFEGSLAGWTLQGGASQVSGSESYGVSGSVGSSSLGIPAGGVAISPATCVNAAYPTFRLFSRTDNPGATVVVSVLYGTGLGQVEIPVGVVTPAGSWQPSAPMLTGSAVPGLLNGGTANVQIKLTAAGGSVQVDDAYVDPWHGCC